MSAPTIDTPVVYKLDDTSAVVTFVTNNNNVPTQGTLKLGTKPDLSDYQSFAFAATGYYSGMQQNLDAVAGPLCFNISLSGLQANTTYYYQGVVSNGNGTNTCGILNFTTQNGPTLAQVDSLTFWATLKDISNYSINVNTFGFTNTVTIAYSTSSDMSKARQLTDTFNVSQVTGYNNSITGLTPSTTYYVQISFNNRGAIARSSIKSFTTAVNAPTPAPTLGSPTVDTLTTNSAAVTFLVNNNNVSTQGHFKLGIQPNLSDYLSYIHADVLNTMPSTMPSMEQNLDAVPGPLCFNIFLYGLQPGTTYYYQGIVSNGNGSNNSGILNFTTVSIPGTVSIPVVQVPLAGVADSFKKIFQKIMNAFKTSK